MENFIGIYKDDYNPKYCNEVISWFDKANLAGFGATRVVRDKAKRHERDDVSVFFEDKHVLNLEPTGNVSANFFDLFWSKYYADYASNFSVLEAYARHTIYSLKVQKTIPGGGYHVWHSEQDSKLNAKRICAFNLYLNTIEDGGETEFLYYGIRVKPEQGTLVIWPAGYTHAHRGNPPLKETKYIVTGWVEFE